MENGDDTCKAEPDENTLSTTISPVKEDSGGLKRPLQDESILEEETSIKKLKTEDGGERVVEVRQNEAKGRPQHGKGGQEKNGRGGSVEEYSKIEEKGEKGGQRGGRLKNCQV